MLQIILIFLLATLLPKGESQAAACGKKMSSYKTMKELVLLSFNVIVIFFGAAAVF